MSKEDYEYIYKHQKEYGKYGSDNHSREHMDKFHKLKPKSVVDIGCGNNEFIKGLKIIKKVGVDIACPSADIVAPADNLPFKNKEFDVLTSFDCLEHLDPEMVISSLREISRVSKRFFMTVCHKKETCWRTQDGKTLHPSSYSTKWWTRELEKIATIIDIYIYSEGSQGDHSLYIGEWK